MHTLIVGGTGFIGKKLTKELISSGYTISMLTRNKEIAMQNNPDNIEFIEWEKFTSEIRGLKEVKCVINLGGESIGDGRWTKARKEKIMKSRLDTTQFIINAIERKVISPRVLINASAIGFYGDRGRSPRSPDVTL